MEKPYQSKRLRLLVGIGVPLDCALFLLLTWWTKKTPPCLFQALTGLHCFGCGSGRALLALLRLDFYAAFRFHPLMILSLPFIGYYLCAVYLSFVFGKPLLPLPTIKSRAFGIVILVVVLAFGILRNIPVFPFTLLAPTAV
ncbi:MAG: DUF2752 domain-containing protein [Clostridia bacterium]|nr:DUF2752 domain-containing protein [Clostridia bacterium]